MGLDGVLREAGFEPIAWYGTHPLELWQLAGVKYIGNDLIGQRIHLSRLRFEKAMGRTAWKLYGILFNKLNWGREIICIAKLKETS